MIEIYIFKSRQICRIITKTKTQKQNTEIEVDVSKKNMKYQLRYFKGHNYKYHKQYIPAKFDKFPQISMEKNAINNTLILLFIITISSL